MALPITIIYPAFGSQLDADRGFVGFPMLDEIQRALPDTITEAGLSAANVTFRAWWVTQPELAKSLKLGSVKGELLPQLLFSLPDPNATDGGLIVVAKLVKSQITPSNIRLMLETVQRLKQKTSAAGKQVFYDPSLQLPIDEIGYNPASAPGGWLIGINATTYKIQLSRYGQMVSNFFTDRFPFILLAVGGLLILTREHKK